MSLQLPPLNPDQQAAFENANMERRSRGLKDWTLPDFIECHPIKFQNSGIDLDALRADNAARRGAPPGAAAAPGAVAPAAGAAPAAAVDPKTPVDLKAPASVPGDGSP